MVGTGRKAPNALCNPLTPPRDSVDIIVQPVILEACLLGPCFLERNEELKMSEDCAQTDQLRHVSVWVAENGTEPGSP